MPEVMSIEVDEEFDPRPPSTPFGLRGPDGSLNYGLIAGIAIAIVLVLMLIFVVVKPFGGDNKEPVSTSKWKPKDPTQNLNYLETDPSTSAMTGAILNSLSSWAKYYTTADLRNLATTFDLTGNQYAKLVAENSAVASKPEEGPPAKITLGPVGRVKRKDDIFTVRVVVNWTKPGAPEETFYKWDIDMKAQGKTYVLSTVRNTVPGETPPLDFCDAIGVIAALEDTDKRDKELKLMTPKKQFEITMETFRIRIKAWEYLETAVAGTDSAEDVKLIADELRALYEAGKATGNLEGVQANAPKVDLTLNREAIQERATSECEGADISKR